MKDSKKDLLVVVDYQKGFVDGTLGFPGAEKLDSIISYYIQDTIAANSPIVVLQDTHYDNYMQTREGRHLPIPHCLAGTPDHQIYGMTKEILEHTPDENTESYGDILYLEKETFGSYEMPLRIDQTWGTPERILVVGLVTDLCVAANAIILASAFPDAEIYVDAKAVASNNSLMHGVALNFLANMHINIINKD